MLTESWLPDNGKANSDDEKLTGVLDEVHVLNQRLLKVRKDVEELCTRATKVRCELAKMRQLRTDQEKLSIVRNGNAVSAFIKKR